MYKELRIPSISFSFDDSTETLVPGFRICSPSAIRIHGSNGAGKSTYFKILGHYLKNSEISFSFVPDRSSFLDFWDNQTLDSFIRSHKCQYLEPLETLNPKKKIFMLSQGEKQLLSLCCFLKKTSRIWIVDESLEHLDLKKKITIRKIFENFIENEGCIIYAQHSEPLWIPPDQTLFIQNRLEETQLCSGF